MDLPAGVVTSRCTVDFLCTYQNETYMIAYHSTPYTPKHYKKTQQHPAQRTTSQSRRYSVDTPQRHHTLADGGRDDGTLLEESEVMSDAGAGAGAVLKRMADAGIGLGGMYIRWHIRCRYSVENVVELVRITWGLPDLDCRN